MWGPEIRGFDGHFLLKRPSETFLGTLQWAPLQILYGNPPLIYIYICRYHLFIDNFLNHKWSCARWYHILKLARVINCWSTNPNWNEFAFVSARVFICVIKHKGRFITKWIMDEKMISFEKGKWHGVYWVENNHGVRSFPHDFWNVQSTVSYWKQIL